MKRRSRLAHAAAGMLQSFVSRNHDIEGYWALGMLYREADAPPQTIVLDLLSETALAPGPRAQAAAHRYHLFLRKALQRQGVEWAALTQATIVIEFNLALPPSLLLYSGVGGDPLRVTVRLVTVHGHIDERSAWARCWPSVPLRFSRRTRFIAPADRRDD